MQELESLLLPEGLDFASYKGLHKAAKQMQQGKVAIKPGYAQCK